MGDDLTILMRGASTRRQIRFASHLFVHPNFNIDTYANDIGVIRTSVPFYQTPTFRAIPRSITTPADNQLCHLAGW